MKKTLSGLAKLTRFNEFGYFVVITTLLGITAAEGVLEVRLWVVLLANGLAVSFAFMVNDIEDAPEDTFSTRNGRRNPVSNGMISTKTARMAAALVGLLAAGLYAWLGGWTFIFGLSCLVLGLMYSLKTIRLKTMALIDILSRGLLLAGLPFLGGYFAYTSSLNRTWLWPFLFVMSISVFHDDHPERRSERGDRLSRLGRTADQLGEQPAIVLMTIIIVVAVSTGIVSLLLIDLVPAWVLIAISGLAIISFLPTYLKARRYKENGLLRCLIIHTFERAGAIGLLLYYLLPWLGRILNSGRF